MATRLGILPSACRRTRTSISVSVYAADMLLKVCEPKERHSSSCIHGRNPTCRKLVQQQLLDADEFAAACEGSVDFGTPQCLQHVYRNLCRQQCRQVILVACVRVLVGWSCQAAYSV